MEEEYDLEHAHAIVQAAARGDLVVIQSLLAEEPLLLDTLHPRGNGQISESLSILDIAAIYGRVNVVDYLLNEKKVIPVFRAGPHIDALARACEKSHLNVIERLLPDKRFDLEIAFFNTIANNNLVSFERLLKDERIHHYDGTYYNDGISLNLIVKGVIFVHQTTGHPMIFEKLTQDERLDPLDIICGIPDNCSIPPEVIQRFSMLFSLFSLEEIRGECKNIHKLKNLLKKLQRLEKVPLFDGMKINFHTLSELQVPVEKLTEEYLVKLYKITEQVYFKYWLPESCILTIQKAIKTNFRLKLENDYEHFLHSEEEQCKKTHGTQEANGELKLGIKLEIKQKAYEMILDSTQSLQCISKEFHQNWLCRLGDEYLNNEENHDDALEIFQSALCLHSQYMEDAVKGLLFVFGRKIEKRMSGCNADERNESLLDSIINSIIKQLGNMDNLSPQTQNILKPFFYNYLIGVQHPKYIQLAINQCDLKNVVGDYQFLREYRHIDSSLFPLSENIPTPSFNKNIVLYYDTLKFSRRLGIKKEGSTLEIGKLGSIQGLNI